MSYFGPPGTWMQFKSRPDNLSLPILEAKRKYLQEQSVFQTFEMQAQQQPQNGGTRFINDSNIYQIVDEWFEDKTRSEGYYGPISSWDVSRVTDMGALFEPSGIYTKGKSVVDGFNEDISSWDTSNVTYMGEMFSNQTVFNQPLDNWNVSNVKRMTYMFSGATSFDQPLNSWDVSNVKDMGGIFEAATSFNGNITSWNVSNASGVEDIGYGMSRMFKDATSFNQNISGWTINSGVTSFYKMFEGTTSFDRNLGGWNITGIDTAEEMFKGVTLSTANYSALLIGWEAGTHNTGAVKFHGGNSQYSAGAAATARATLVSEGWVITDGGQA
tara:strand:+ start:92 stop:1075 length:984 start_codon:yes stop_codon:yes gene_type:complete